MIIENIELPQPVYKAVLLVEGQRVRLCSRRSKVQFQSLSNWTQRYLRLAIGCDISSKRAVLPKLNDAEKGPAKSLHASQ